MCGVLWSGRGGVCLPLSLAEDQFSGASGSAAKAFPEEGVSEHPQRFGGSRTWWVESGRGKKDQLQAY